MKIVVHLGFVEFFECDTSFMQDVFNLVNFRMEVFPRLRVILNEGATYSFLGYGKESSYLRVLPALEETKIALRQELHLFCHFMVIVLPAKYILFLQCITFSQRLYYVIKYVHVRIIQVCISCVLLYRVFNLQNNRTVPLFREKYSVDMVAISILDVLQLREKSIEYFFLPSHV